jgi:IMP dehydrogenase/GMP reductase
MAKQNDKATKKATKRTKEVQPETTDPTVQSGTVETETIQEGTAGKSESGEEKLPVSTKQSNGEQKDDKGNTKLDTGGQEKTTGQEGGNTGNQVNHDTQTDKAPDEPEVMTTKRKQIADDVFSKHPQCKELHFTADLIPFFVKSDAFRHGAGSLKNDTIVTIYRKK